MSARALSLMEQDRRVYVTRLQQAMCAARNTKRVERTEIMTVGHGGMDDKAGYLKLHKSVARLHRPKARQSKLFQSQRRVSESLSCVITQ